MRRTVILACCLAVCSAFAEKQPFDRYQPIVDRQMFGPLPPDFDPTKPASEAAKSSDSEKELTQEQAKLQSAIHFSVINITPEGATAVGFTDQSDPKSPVGYYLKVGESRNGWTVKAADPKEATMTIAKGEVEVTLHLGDNSAKGGGTTSRAGTAAAPQGQAPRFGRTLLSRRMKRRAEAEEAQAKAAAQEAERQKQAAEEKAQNAAMLAEQQQQLQAIREELIRTREERQRQAKKASEQESTGENNESQ